MSEFILRIFFSGLIAFVPNSDGTEVTVVLVSTPHEYTLASDTALPHHYPLMLARAGSCDGECVTADQPAIAQFLFANKTPTQAQTALNGAISGGGAWQLSHSDLTVNGPTEPLAIRTGTRKRDANGVLAAVPSTATEREDFSWVADLTDLAPATGGFITALSLNEPPPSCTVAARLKLKSGKLFTYSLVRIDAKARPVHFRKATGEGPEAPYAQALANWVAAEIRVPGDVVEIVDQDFTDSSKSRTMRLRPQEGVVELALLNLPPYEAPDPDAPAATPAPGGHFELFYDLVKRPPTHSNRLIPHVAVNQLASDPQTDWATLHPRAPWSNLLEQLGLNPRGKGPYDLALCPIIKD